MHGPEGEQAVGEAWEGGSLLSTLRRARAAAVMLIFLYMLMD